MIAIINYGLGNLGSIANMLKVIGEKTIITNNADEIDKADKIILPGVGAFDTGMKQLNEKGLVDVIRFQALDKKKPILGICLGMQLLGRKSEEGSSSGLSLIPFDNIKFKLDNTKLKVPHMGWDIISIKQQNNLVYGLTALQRFYFVHSYHAKCDCKENVLMSCDYGYEFTAAIVEENIYGVQFHPEKSHNFGLALLSNFVKRC